MTPVTKVIASSGLLAGIAGIGLGGWYLLTKDVHTFKDIQPDYPTAAEPTVTAITPAVAATVAPVAPVAAPAMAVLGKTGYKRIDAILPQLRASAQASGIPLGLMVGWIAKESGGKLSDTTSLNERGLYQLMPSESATLGLDHERLSTDLQYSIDAGPKLIKHYMAYVSDLGTHAPAGSSYLMKLTKLAHCVGSGQVKKIVKGAVADGKAGSWRDLESYALGIHVLGPQPKKWFPMIDAVARVGQPFGFGTESSAMVAGLLPHRGLDLLGAEAI